MMNTALLLTFLFMYDIRTCYSQGLLGSFVDFFNVNSPDASTGDSFNSSADGFSDFPPDPDFPPFGPDPGPSPDPGPGPGTGFPQDAGFPADPPASANTDSAASGTGNQNAPIDTGVPSGTESSLTKNQQTVTEQFLPTDVGPSVGQVSPVQNTLSASGANNIGDNTNPIDPLIPGLSAQLTPLDPGLGGLPPQSGSPTPVDINAGGLPAQPGSPIPMDVNAVGLPAQTGSLTPVDINAGGQAALPGSPTQVDINAGGLPAQPTDFGSNNLPPFVIDSGDQQSGTGPSGPTQLDFHFLPVLPSGGNFVNLITGQTNTFQPSLGWIGDPGRPADISVEGPGSSVPLVDPAQIDTGMPNPDPPLTTNVIDVPADANLPPSNLPPEPPVALPVAPVETATPIETKPPVQHEGPFFVDPLSAFFDTPPADNQGPTQTDTTIFADNSVSGVNQDVTAGNQGGAISGGKAPEMIFPSGNQGDAFGSSIFPETISRGGNQEWATGGSVFPETISPGGNQGDAMGGSTVPETIPSNMNQAGILTLFDRNDLSSPSQSLGNNKPAVLPFATSGTGNPVATNVVQQKERLPDSWVKLYREGREPRRQNPAFASESAPGETIEVSAADRILSDISLGSFGRNRDLQRKLRKRLKQQRKQKKLLRQRQRERQQELQSQWQQPASQQPVSQQPARRQSRRQQRRGGNQRKGRQNRQRQNARLTVPSGGASSNIARMVLPGTDQPFVGKHQRGKRSVQTCSDLQRSLGLCSHGLAYPKVEYHVVSDTKAETNHHRRYKRNVQVCDPFSQLMGLCASNGMAQTQTHLVDTTGILTSNTGAIGNEAKPSVQEKKTPVTQTGVQSHVIGLHHLLGPVSNSILSGLAPITPEIMAVKNPVSQIFGQILNEAGQAANQGLRDLGRIVNNPGTNTQPLFEELANVLGGQPIPQIGNIDLSPLGILGEGVMLNEKGIPDSKPLGEVMKIKPPKKPMASKNKRNKPIVNEAGEMKSVDLSQSLGRSPTEFPSNGVNVISDPGFFNLPVNLASQVGPILSQSLDSVHADHVLDTHTGIPTLLPSKTGQKTKGLEKQIRGTEPIALPGVKTQMNTVLINSDVGQPLLNPSIDLIPGDLSQPLGTFPADHVLDTHTDVPMLLPSKPEKKRKEIQKKIQGGSENKNPSIKKADQSLGDLSQPFGEFPVDHVLDTHTGVPMLLPLKLGKERKRIEKKIQGGNKIRNPSIKETDQILGDLSQPFGAFRDGHVLDTHTGVPMLLPLKPGNERKGIQKKIRGGNKIRNPSIKETDQILGDLSQPFGAFPADHVLDTHTGVPMLLPSKPGKKRKGIRKKNRGGNKSRNLSIKESGQIMPVNLSPLLDLGPDSGTPSGGIVFSGTEILSDQINIAPELGPILPDADQIAIQGLNPKQAEKGIHPALGPLIGDLSPPIGAVPADHVLDTHTGIPMLIPSKPGKKNKGLEKQILGTEPLALPGGSTKSINTVLSNSDVNHPFLNPPIDQILGDLSQPLGEFQADHILDTHTGVPMLLPSKPGKKRKGTGKRIRNGNNNRSPSIKGAEQILGDLSQPLGEFPADHVLDTHTGVPMLLPSKPGKKRKGTRERIQGSNNNRSPSIKGAEQILGDLSQPLGEFPADHVLDTHTGVPMLLPSKSGKKRKEAQKNIRGGNNNRIPSINVAEQILGDLSQPLGEFPADHVLDTHTGVPMLLPSKPGKKRKGTQEKIRGGNNNRNPSIKGAEQILGDLSQPLGEFPADQFLDTHTGVPMLLPSKPGKKRKGTRKKIRGSNKNRNPSVKEAGQMMPANLSPSIDLSPDRGTPGRGIAFSSTDILNDLINVVPELGQIQSDADRIAIQGLSPNQIDKGIQPVLSPLIGDSSPSFGAVPTDHVLDTHAGAPILLPSRMRSKSKELSIQVKGDLNQDKATMTDAGQMRPANVAPLLGLDPTGGMPHGGIMLSNPSVLSDPMNVAPALGPILSDAEQLAITGVNTQPFNAGPVNYEGRQPGVNPLVDTTSVDSSQPVGAVPADHLLDPHTGVLDTLPLKEGKKNKGQRKPMKGSIRRKKRNFKKVGPMTSVDLPQQFDPGQNGDTLNNGILLTDPVMAGTGNLLGPLGANRLDQVLNIHPGVQDTLPSQQRKKKRGRKKSMRGGNKRKKPFIKKAGQLRPIDLSQHISQGQDHVNGGSLVSGPTNLDSPTELSFSNTAFLNSEPLTANTAALPAGHNHNMQNPITQPIIKGPASFEGRQLVIGQPSNVNSMDFTQPLDPVLTEQVWGERNNGLNPKARSRRRKRRNKLMSNRNRKNRRTNAQRRPVMREVVQMKPVTLPQLPLQGSSVEIQTPEALLAVHGQPSGHGDIKLLSTNVNIEGSNMQPDVIHPDGHVADHVTVSVDQSMPLKKRKNPRALARQRLKVIQKLRQKNKRRNQQNMREKQQNNRGNQQNQRGNQQNQRGNRQNKRRNGPRKEKVKVAKIMETVNLANGEKLPVTQPTTRPPNLDCFTGICIDWSGKKK